MTNKKAAKPSFFKRTARLAWLVFLSIFPISSLLKDLELDEENKDKAPPKDDHQED